MHLDKYGLIVQANGDGGDTLQREGFYALGLFLQMQDDPIAKHSIEDVQGTYKQHLELLNPEKHTWRRHPDQWNDPKDVSRDQMTPNIIACGFFNISSHLKDAGDMVSKNWFRFPNGDLCGPESFGHFFRAYHMLTPSPVWALSVFVFYFLLLLGDSLMLFNSVIRIVKNKRNPDDVGDDLNHCAALIQAKHYLATPISWLARKLFKTFQPIERNLRHYFRPESGGNPEIAEVWCEVVRRQF